MNGATDSIGVRESFSELALWAGASLLVLSLHVGAAMWLLREPDMIAADDTPPAAIMIELAETPEATETEENEISPDEVMSDASAAAQKVEEPVDEPVLEQEVVQDEPEPVEEEPREEIAQLDKVEVPLPVAKPKPPEPKKEIVKKDEPKKKPVKQREQASAKQAVKAQAQVTQSSRNAARQSASGLFASSMTPARWQSRLMAHLERRKKYPSGAKSRREEGTVYVRFRIDDSGKVLSATLARSSGWPELDNEVLSLVQRASPVPAPPPDVNKTITAPVKFNRR
ncbi:cell envelope integrity protein TolA [Brucella pseudogrignonensis]|uniref:cell envelope integrity protein TolA n=1 Tax=Brucella pseudogrignonensis TaxID=419475 RepID=UPI000CFAC59A|nr:energy transducer TonB [Brucella pseudogrignonensis]MQP41544.1 TonB family protein [Ochrobactrum sp. MYb237]PQZ40101.1 energy transducer TonB [Brucella pseudogrignonensis]PRA39740.1 energy transducer TonB [Brucella pseudogrignonensis]PRA66173.1 energy transducer TonB [Brucella pseudogrignonensis]